MRLTALFLAMVSIVFSGCIQEQSTDSNSGYGRTSENNDGDDNWGCAPAPSGTGSWEDEASDGLHCNYLRDGTDDWAYTLNSSETICLKTSWAPKQNYGSIKLWNKNGNKGCDWVIRYIL